MVLLTRLLSAAGYGVYAAILALTLLVQGTAFMWLQTGIIRFHSRARDPAALVALARFARSAYVAVAALVAAGWTAGLLLIGPTPMEVAVGLAGLVLLLLRGWLGIVQAWNRVCERSWHFAAVEALNGIGTLALAVVGLLLFPGEPLAAFAGGIAAALVAIAASTELLRLPRAAEGGAETRQLLRAMSSYGVPLTLATAAGSLLLYSDRLVILALLGPAAAGVYSVSGAIANRAMLLLFLSIALTTKPAVFAAFERDGEAAASDALEGAASWFMAAGLPALTVMVLAPLPITQLLVGGGMAGEAARLLPWTAAGAFLAGLLSHHFGLAFQLRLNTHWMLAAVAPPAILNIVANVVLLPRFGVIAAGWMTVAGYGAALALAVLLGRRHFRVPLPLGDLARTLVACLPLAGFLLLPFPAGAAGLALMLGGSALVYAAAAFALDLCGIRGGWSARRLGTSLS